MRVRPKLSGRGGATTVETAMVIFLFLLLMFSIFEYGRMVMLQHLMINGAPEGCRYAVVHTTDTTNGTPLMVARWKRRRRNGTILPLLVISIVALFGFVALAVDIGMVALARTQCQNAADCAALTGARTLSGDPANNNNFDNCEPGA